MQIIGYAAGPTVAVLLSSVGGYSGVITIAILLFLASSAITAAALVKKLKTH